jgi:uncharacterized protein (TIGR02284 family)
MTKEFMPSKDLIEAEGTLRRVIENLIDAQEGLQRIGEDSKNETLRRYFLAESLKRAEFRGELENILHREGVRDLYETGTPAGALVRAWTGLKLKLGGGDHALLESAEEGERSALDAYADALQKDLPLPIREVLAGQAAHISKSHQYVTAARDSSK